MAVDDYAEDVLKVLNWIDQPAILIGHSMGGITVQKAAEQKNLRALILLASVGPGQLGAIRDPLPPDKTFMFSPEQARKIWFYKIDNQSFNAIYQQLIPESVSVINNYSAGDVRIDRSKIRCPIFVIGAEHDQTVVHNFQIYCQFPLRAPEIKERCRQPFKSERVSCNFMETRPLMGDPSTTFGQPCNQ